MQIIDIYQPVHEDMDGRQTLQNEYYYDYAEAKRNCNGIGISPEPKKLMGLQLRPGEAYIFVDSTPARIFNTTDDLKRERALAKLTPEERKLLGHG